MFRSLPFALLLVVASLAEAQMPRVTLDGEVLETEELRRWIVASHGSSLLDKWQLRLLCRQELAERRARGEAVPDLGQLEADVQAGLDQWLEQVRRIPRIEGGELYELGGRTYTLEALRLLIEPELLFERTFFDADANTWPDFLRVGLEEPTMLGQFEGMRLRAMRLQAGDPEVKPFGDMERRVRRSVIERILREKSDVRRFAQPLPDRALLGVNGEFLYLNDLWPLVEPSLNLLDRTASAAAFARSTLALRDLEQAGTLLTERERLVDLRTSMELEALAYDLARAAGVPSIDVYRAILVKRLSFARALEARGETTRDALERSTLARPDLHPGTMIQASVILFASWDFELDRHLGAQAHERARERATKAHERLGAGEDFDALRESLCEYPVNLLTVRRDIASTMVKIPDCKVGILEPKIVSDFEYFLGIRPYRILAGPPTFQSFPYEDVVSADAVGKVLGPIEVPYGFVILRIESFTPGSPLELAIPRLYDQVKERVIDALFHRFLTECVQGHRIEIRFS